MLIIIVFPGEVRMMEVQSQVVQVVSVHTVAVYGGIASAPIVGNHLLVGCVPLKDVHTVLHALFDPTYLQNLTAVHLYIYMQV